MIKYSHEFAFVRDTHFGIPTYNSERSRMNFDFYFKFKIPKPNKERLILERDQLRKIATSKVPDVPIL